MTALSDLLGRFRTAAVTNRESGTYFEELTVLYLRTEPAYRDLYHEVWTYSDWAAQQGLDKRDAGIDLVAETFDKQVHAIQCKLYAEDYKLQKADIDSFFTASGKKPFAHRVIISTTSLWSEHAEDALRDQQPPVTKIDLAALEDSVIDWSRFEPRKTPTLHAKKALRRHQRDALAVTLPGLETHSRGKLIMACGTGKTFTSLKIAEEAAGKGKRVLFLVPSLALLSQALTEWTQESTTPLHSFAVCSDGDVGKKRQKDDDSVQTFVHELRYPATTDAARLAKEMKKRHDTNSMSVVYGTYHSIDVIHRAQHEHGLPAFDLIVCDEAHRTTGATFEGEDESNFVKVHDEAFIRGKKRLYMTATPRIYGDVAKVKADQTNVALCSMDDSELFGPELYVITFSEAVKRGLLVDYKVIVLSVSESHVSARIQNLLKDENNELRVDDAAKIVGCWKALAKQGLEEALPGDVHPMKRAVAFCQVIEAQKGKKGTHKVSSKNIAGMFQAVVEAYQATEGTPDEGEDDPATQLRCEAAHVDGSMNASEKEAKLSWLKGETDADVCRILSNVRCLSEGVDVPALDAVLFLTPRNSQIDVVQSVGRVMRNAPGKQRGYIVLPVVIPHGIEPHEALDDNQTYKVVWQVLQALRSHDDRFDAMVNKLDLIGRDPSKMEVIAITDKIPQRKSATPENPSKDLASGAKGGQSIGTTSGAPTVPVQRHLEFEIGEIERAIYAKLVQKVGNRRHWEDWAKDIAKIAQTHIGRIQGILADPKNSREIGAFQKFAEELRDDLNDSITNEEVVEMLAQHLVTKPVFEALFSGHSFATQNPMSVAMQGVLDVLEEHRLDKEASTLDAFYRSVKLRAEGIDNAEGKQKIVVELYDKFFRNAFPKMSERLGIVYTPVEIVDFILHSVDHLLRTEFDQTLGSKDVHIIDPFTGTGTFITRLLQSGLIDEKALRHKYKHEIHANELVLLAYYIAAINIEAAYHGIVGGEYEPFEGICLTDTFQMYEKDDLISAVLEDNSARRKRQKKLDIRVIIGNPPYSVGQATQNDNNQNVAYPHLDARIAETYGSRSQATNKNALYDSYVRAIRWASDRVGASGVIGFVTNANFVEASTADGLRQCLVEEFSSIYVLHLRGNQRTSGERSRREGGKVFGSGSRAPVAISLLVKNPHAQERGAIHFRDVGDYLTREEKLGIVARFGSVAGVDEWPRVTPDGHGDWLRQRDAGYSRYVTLGDKTGGEVSVFGTYSNGVKTSRDAWVFNASRRQLGEQITRMISCYDAEVERLNAKYPTLDKKGRVAIVDAFVDTDATKISWDRALKGELAKGNRLKFEPRRIVPSLYRPFTKQWLYFDRKLNEMIYQIPRIFPSSAAENRVIGVSAREPRSGYSVLMVDTLPELCAADMGGSQYFPLYLYAAPGEGSEPAEDAQVELFETRSSRPTGVAARRDGITDAGLAHFASSYPGETITKEDVFYFVYGMLHSEEYRERYADNLGKELPRIPRVKTAADFWAFSRAGRALGELHVGYERAPEYPACIEAVGVGQPAEKVVKKAKGAGSGKRAEEGISDVGPARYSAAPMGTSGLRTSLAPARLRVEKMKFGKGKDKTVIHYNEFITVRDIPLEAYEYVVNGKPAIEWVMERQSVTTDKASGIEKDANDWAIETMNDPSYPLSLLLRVITVSLETTRIVRGLPTLNILEDSAASSATEFAAVVVPDLATIKPDAWTRPHATERGEVQAAVVAVLKSHGEPMDLHQARLASLLCLEPHLLTPMLDKTEKAQWTRVVGSDAKRAANAAIDATTQEWGAALAGLRGRERVLEDLQENTWALGTGTEAIETSGWPEGRASFVVDVLRRLQQSTQVDEIIQKLPTTAKLWMAHAA